jgi:phospholipase/carboxylesterase
MRRSMMVYRQVPSSQLNLATIVALHGRGGDVDELVPLGRELHPNIGIVSPQAVRPVSAAENDQTVHDHGYRWYFGEEDELPEPATLGESLWQVEQFVADLRDGDSHASVYLLGRDQGAVVALMMAQIIPDWLSGIIAIGGCLPRIRGWAPVESPCRLPVLWLRDCDEKADSLESLHGACVTHQVVPGIRHDAMRGIASIRAWLDARVTA